MAFSHSRISSADGSSMLTFYTRKESRVQIAVLESTRGSRVGLKAWPSHSLPAVAGVRCSTSMSVRQRVAAGPHLRRCPNRFELANVICGKLPVPGTLHDKPFVIVTGQRRIELRMATIERNEERPFRITLSP